MKTRMTVTSVTFEHVCNHDGKISQQHCNLEYTAPKKKIIDGFSSCHGKPFSPAELMAFADRLGKSIDFESTLTDTQ